MARTLPSALAVAALALWFAPAGRASLYQPDELTALPVRPDGTGEALPFDEFKRRLAVLGNVGNPDPAKATADRQRVKERIDRRLKAGKLPPDETVALAADLLRYDPGNPWPLNHLPPLTRGRSPNYYAAATLAHLHAARGDWNEAVDSLGVALEDALVDADRPPPVKGLTPAQQAWQTKLDRDYVLHLLHLNRQEAARRPRPNPADETPTPLFPVPKRGTPADPVRFVNDAGVYEPGTLAAAERAKLPPDAVAVAQQLLLWFPGETPLYWLLAELYAAGGDLDAARKIMDECVSEAKQYGNRKELVAHRAAVRAAVEARNAARDEARRQADIAAYPVSWRTLALYGGAVGLVAVVAAVRAVRGRRPRRDGGPAGRP